MAVVGPRIAVTDIVGVNTHRPYVNAQTAIVKDLVVHNAVVDPAEHLNSSSIVVADGVALDGGVVGAECNSRQTTTHHEIACINPPQCRIQNSRTVIKGEQSNAVAAVAQHTRATGIAADKVALDNVAAGEALGITGEIDAIAVAGDQIVENLIVPATIEINATQCAPTQAGCAIDIGAQVIVLNDIVGGAATAKVGEGDLGLAACNQVALPGFGTPDPIVMRILLQIDAGDGVAPGNLCPWCPCRGSCIR